MSTQPTGNGPRTTILDRLEGDKAKLGGKNADQAPQVPASTPTRGADIYVPVASDPREQSILRFIEFNSASISELADFLLDGTTPNKDQVAIFLELDADHIGMILEKLMQVTGDFMDLSGLALTAIVEGLATSPKFLDVMTDEMKALVMGFAEQVDIAHPKNKLAPRLLTAISGGEAYSELHGYTPTEEANTPTDLIRSHDGEAPQSFDDVMAMIIGRIGNLEGDNEFTLSKLANGGDYSEAAITAAKSQFDKNTAMLGVLRGMASSLSDFEREKSRIWG